MSGLLFGLVLTVVLGVIIVLVLPLLVFIAEALFILCAIVVLRGTWIIEASTEGPPSEKKAWRVRGWARSKRAVQEVASELRAGVEAAPAEAEPA
jgi:hypothetical protein